MAAFQSNQNSNNLYNNFVELTQKVDSTKSYFIDYQYENASDTNNVVFSTITYDTSITITPKPVGQNKFYSSALFLTEIVSLLIISLILVGYLKYLKVIIQSLFYDFIAEKTINDFSIPFVKLSRLLDLLSIFSSMLIFIVLYRYFIENNLPPLLLLLVPVLAILLYRIWIWLLHKAIELSTYKTNLIKSLQFHNVFIIKILMFFLAPLSIIINYTVMPLKSIFMFVAVSLIVVALLYRYFLIVRIFMKQRVSILYFILYLCALEMPAILGVTYYFRIS